MTAVEFSRGKQVFDDRRRNFRPAQRIAQERERTEQTAHGDGSKVPRNQMDQTAHALLGWDQLFRYGRSFEESYPSLTPRHASVPPVVEKL